MSTATADKPRASGRRAALQAMAEAAYLEAQALTQDHEKERLCHRCLWNRTPCNLSEYTVLLQSGGWR